MADRPTTPEDALEEPRQAQHRRTLRRDHWISWGLTATIVGLLLLLAVAGSKQVHKDRARQAAQDAWQRQQTEAMQALVEDVRRLRDILEERR